MISAKPLELKIQQKKNRSKNNWSNFSVAYLEISHRKESENHVWLGESDSMHFSHTKA